MVVVYVIILQLCLYLNNYLNIQTVIENNPSFPQIFVVKTLWLI